MKYLIRLIYRFNKYILLILIFFTIILISCRKEFNYTDRPPFTSDQLGWINTIPNPSYRCVYKNITNQGDTIITSDTLTADIRVYNNAASTTEGELINYYTGDLYFWLGHINTPSGLDPDSYSVNVDINNLYDFTVIFSELRSVNISHYNTDTAFVSGKLYSDVYKVLNLGSIKKVFFKKEIGLLYIEKTNGNYATLLK